MGLSRSYEIAHYPYRYRIYGLNLQSALEIPELTPTDESRTDAEITFGDVPSNLDNALARYQRLEFGDGKCLLKVPGIGRFLITEGNSIRIDRREDRSRRRGQGSPVADVRVYLLGSALGALLHQRRWMPLHVSAVQADSGVWAFTGNSGAGKSTLAACLHRRFRWPIVSDDVSVLRPHDKIPMLHPGPRKLKLWQDAVNHLGFHGQRMSQDLSHTDKYQLYLEDHLPQEPGRLRALVVLDRCAAGETPGLEQLSGIRAFEAITASVYRPLFAKFFRQPEELMENKTRLAGEIEVYRFRRPWTLEGMVEQLDPLLSLMGSQPKVYGI